MMLGGAWGRQGILPDGVARALWIWKVGCGLGRNQAPPASSLEGLPYPLDRSTYLPVSAVEKRAQGPLPGTHLQLFTKNKWITKLLGPAQLLHRGRCEVNRHRCRQA